ncbi:hypothetical protein G3I18_32190 [Actinospica acidiphila]|uniref:Uncharacterized protein n=1 Tax=Actinospica acidiphila TaxID=304899 RepID=A0A9X5HFK2_9ACTN|nr:hypothetical protein [Actinospica acidiphila]
MTGTGSHPQGEPPPAPFGIAAVFALVVALGEPIGTYARHPAGAVVA